MLKSRPVASTPLLPAWRRSALLYAAILLATFAAYSNSFSVPFLFDDQSAILRNPSIRKLWSADVFSAPLNATGATGRPLVNLSLAINHALGRTSSRGYHVFNFLLHASNALLLLGLVRRIFESNSLRPHYGGHASVLAFTTALIWAVHPLQTESVTFVIQRTELLGGFFLLLTLYCFARTFPTAAVSAAPHPGWTGATIVACGLGMLAKEFMVTAPVLALLYDRCFQSGSFSVAWRNRPKLYIALASCWVILVAVLFQFPQRNNNVGFGLGMSSWDYLLTQCRAIVMYLRLALWPHPLVLDYGVPLVSSLREVIGSALLVVTLAASTSWALWRKPALGFAGAWLFIILSPSSSFVPLTTQTMAEHRMYLPLAAVVATVVGVVWGRFRRVAPVLLFSIAAACAAVTFARNQDYRSGVTIWSDTVRKAPDNHRAHYNLGNALAAEGRSREALSHYEQALRLRPKDPTIRYNYASVLLELGHLDQAVIEFEAAIQLGSDTVDVRVNLGSALARSGRYAAALPHYARAAELEPSAPDIQTALGTLLILSGRIDDGLRALLTAVQLQPENPDAHARVVNALLEAGRPNDALRHLTSAVRQYPSSKSLRLQLTALEQQLRR